MKICLSAGILERCASGLHAVAPDAELLRIEADGGLSGPVEGVDIFLLSQDLLEIPGAMRSVGKVIGSASLRWLQSVGAGVDHPVFGALLERGVRVTNASGLHAEPIAQYVLAQLLFWEKRVAELLAFQRERRWQSLACGELTGRTLGIAGLGGIGRVTARLAKACGMRVLATKRSPVEDPNVDELLAPGELPKLLAESHYAVLCVPLTDATRGMLGAAELAAMRPDAVLVNVARGDVVDEPALIEALRERRIRGATLDVVSQEPLPPDSPLWELENCVITNHSAGHSPLLVPRLTELFLDNLGRYLRGEPLRNEVKDVELTRRKEAD